MTQQNLPNPASDNTTRFEGDARPRRHSHTLTVGGADRQPIRDDAKITVSTRQQNGYYVEIYNGPSSPPPEVNDLINEVLTEAGMHDIEHALLAGAPGLLEFAVGAFGVLASVLPTSPLLAENFYRGTMDVGTQVTYAVRTPRKGKSPHPRLCA